MRKIIAVTGPHNARTRQLVKTLLTALSLLHINIRQPIVDFSASCLNVDSHHLDHHIPLQQYFSELKMNLREMQSTIEAFLCVANKNYLIDFAENEMAKAEFMLGHGSRGFIVSNITTESEATWIRNNGGILIHTVDEDCLASAIRLKDLPGDQHVTTSNQTPPTAANLSVFIDQLKARMTDGNQQAA